MSNGSPSPTADPAPDRPGRTATVTVVMAALLPACFIGWLAWQPAGGPSPTSDKPPWPGASASASAAPDSPTPSRARDPLAGKVIVIDPGHNPHNRDHPDHIARQVDIGTNRKECDTTGTSTSSGYAEASFTLDVSRRLRTLLEKRGARVTLTHNGDRPYGPCVDERARIGNRAHADAVVSVHADGSAVGHRGFHVLLPARVKAGRADTSAIVGPSRALGERIARGFARATGSRPANYVGAGTGLKPRSDLGGLNLSTVPKVFIECGNMRDPKDAAQLTSAAWRARAAAGIADGIEQFLTSKG